MSNGHSDIVKFSLINNNAHNIFSLPVELLQIIFVVILTDTFWESREFPPPLGINIPKIRTELQLVCKLWQSSILSCSHLWVYVDLEFLSSAAVWRTLELSGSAPLWLNSLRRTSRGAGKGPVAQEARLVAELLKSEGHRIAVLMLDEPVFAAVSKRPQANWTVLPCEATALQYLDLNIPEENALASHPPWPLLLSRAPNLTRCKLSGMSHQPFWGTLSTAPITRLRCLELERAVFSAMADFARLAKQLPNLERIILDNVTFTENTSDAAASLENLDDIQLPRLKHLGIEYCDSIVFCLIGKLVLLPQARIVLEFIHVDADDTDLVLRAIPRIAAGISPNSMYDLSLLLSEGRLELYGYKNRGIQFANIYDLHLEPDLVLRLSWTGSSVGPHPTAVHFVRGIYERLPLEHTRVLTLELPSGPGAIHRDICALRAVFARLVHVEAIYVDNSTDPVCMASLATLLHIDDGKPVPLPQLTALWFSKSGQWSWCPECATTFVHDLCKVLRMRAAAGRPIARVLSESFCGLNVPEAVEAAVRALVSEFSEKIRVPGLPRMATHKCF
ncbi:hypothetical protein PsYK624_163690 [Phanerochaete sordida]|uniref:F-box domain-containing protein n=1 Tax=Phanerochaete sordida TaxID=48140 RepID=A0A9P3LMX3_9APHY|nr:hypothetical protein PsYK624_163690 [Phanerochaete sordida]